MTDEELVKILRISDEASTKYAADRIEALMAEVEKLKHIISEKPDITPPIRGELMERFQRLWEACVGLHEKADFKAFFRYTAEIEKKHSDAKRQSDALILAMREALMRPERWREAIGTALNDLDKGEIIVG